MEQTLEINEKQSIIDVASEEGAKAYNAWDGDMQNLPKIPYKNDIKTAWISGFINADEDNDLNCCDNCGSTSDIWDILTIGVDANTSQEQDDRDHDHSHCLNCEKGSSANLITKKEFWIMKLT